MLEKREHVCEESFKGNVTVRVFKEKRTTWHQRFSRDLSENHQDGIALSASRRCNFHVSIKIRRAQTLFLPEYSFSRRSFKLRLFRISYNKSS